MTGMSPIERAVMIAEQQVILAKSLADHARRNAPTLEPLSDQEAASTVRRINRMLPQEAWDRIDAEIEQRHAKDIARGALRRARVKASPQIEKIDRLTIWDRDQGICHICGKPADRRDFHLDHVIPLARGGHHTYANLKVSHPSCNAAKGARL